MEERKRLGSSEFEEEFAMRLLDWMDALPVFACDELLQAQKKAMYVRLTELSGKTCFNLENAECQVVWYTHESESKEDQQA